jgi:outer membrane lipase/esterase
VHPTGAAHAMLANVILSTLSAPGDVSFAAEVPLQVYNDHSDTLNRQMFRAGVRNDDQSNVYANVQFTQQDLDATANTSAMDNDLFTLTLGADTRFNEHFSFGAAATFGSSSGDIATGTSVDNREFLISGYGVAHYGRGYAGLVLSGGSARFDIDRAIVLGPETRIETGGTQASHTGAELVTGFTFGEDVRHGPFASLTWQHVDVDGYREESNDSTSMWFGDFERKSTVGRLGYQAEGDLGGFNLFGKVAYAHDSQDRVPSVQAGSNTMNGHFTLDGYPGADSWYEGDLGVGWQATDNTTFSLSYRGRFNDDTQDLSSFNVGVEMKF